MTSFRDFKPKIPHLERPGGGLQGGLWDLREDVKQWSDTLVSTGAIHLYVEPTDGRDTNIGTVATKPLKTIAAAVAKIPHQHDHHVFIHLANGIYSWTKAITSQGTGVVALIGDGAGQPGQDGFTQLVAPSAAQSGSSAIVLVTAGGLTANQYLGKTVEILTGAAAGNRRSIRSNTTTDLIPTVAFTAAVAASDQYRIVEPAAIIDMPGFVSANQLYQDFIPFFQGLDGGNYNNITGSTQQNPLSRGLLINIRLRGPATSGILHTMWISGSAVSFYGVEAYGESFLLIAADQSSSIASGGELHNRCVVPQGLGLISDGQAWRGWGTYSVSAGQTVGWQMTSAFRGHLCSNHVFTIAGVPTTWSIWGGGFFTTTAGSFILDQGAKLRLGPVISSEIKPYVRCEQAAVTATTILVRGGAELHISNVVVEKSGQGHAIVAQSSGSGNQANPGRVSIGSGMQITAENSANFALAVYNGGEINYRSGTTFTGWPAGQQLAVRKGSFSVTGGTTVQDEDASFLVVGEALPSAATADPRYGLIRFV